jgi:hypothetical protein
MHIQHRTKNTINAQEYKMNNLFLNKYPPIFEKGLGFNDLNIFDFIEKNKKQLSF